jgi:serine/threonine protein kinase
MISSFGNAIVKVVKCKWSDKGSKQRLLDFLHESDPWLQATSSLCDNLNVTIEDYSSRQEQEKEQEHEQEQEQEQEKNQKQEQIQSSFLGAGANGRVFKLSNDKVIKIVIGKKSNEVEKEYTIMLKYQETNDLKNFVFPVVEGSFKSGHIGRLAYAGYLLAKEGEKIQNFNSVKIKKSLASALYGLHSCNVIHGDPRIDNVLVLDGSLKWIDFRQSDPFATKFSKRYDVEILLTSLNLSVSNVDKEIEEYVNDSNLEKLCQVLLKPKNQEFEK